jgi:hypothetical protein
MNSAAVAPQLIDSRVGRLYPTNRVKYGQMSLFHYGRGPQNDRPEKSQLTGGAVVAWSTSNLT